MDKHLIEEAILIRRVEESFLELSGRLFENRLRVEESKVLLSLTTLQHFLLLLLINNATLLANNEDREYKLPVSMARQRG